LNPFKRYLPKTLFGRAILIIILPVMIMQIVVAYIFFNAHWTSVTASLSDSVAADVSMTVELYEQSPGNERAVRLDAMTSPHMQLSMQLVESETLPTANRRAFFSVLDKTLQRALSQSLEHPFWFDTTRYPNHIDIRVEVEEGTLRFIAPRERVFAPTGFVFIFWLVLASVLLTLISIYFIRNQAKPISKLAAAADAFGKGQDIADFKPSGAVEVRLAGQSFLKMRQRIGRFMDQRTTMLAGVSHDLRTPLTRLNLHLAMQEDNEDNRAARADIKDMETMLNGYLDFAQGLSDEEVDMVELSEFLTSIINKSADPKPILNSSETIEIPLKPIAMARAISNLFSNSQKYADQIRISTRRESGRYLIELEDNGPGISPENYDNVFKPFFRVDSARNQNVEGTGLGLSITRDIIRSHGGTISLSQSDLGGLKTTISLPH